MFAWSAWFAVNLFAEPTNYTYNYDYWNEQVESPDAYRVSAYLLGSQFGIGNFVDPQGLFVRDNRIYICDSGNNRIVVFSTDNRGNYAVSEIIDHLVINGAEETFNYPSDIYETLSGHLYICDTNNNRVLHIDAQGNYLDMITKPVDQSIDAGFVFLPVKAVVDSANRIYIQAKNVNKGLMEFDNRGEFIGYMGANRVQVKIVDYIWKLLSSQAQRAQMDLFVPTEYNNLALDNEGFIYVTNSTGQTYAVRRLNPMGQDILLRNGYKDPVGDVVFGNAGGIQGPSKFIDVTALANESYACFDRTRGRIFVYDFQGNLLYAFGGVGNREGYFMLPVALDSMGDSLFALDSRTATLTRFDLTEYGLLVRDALNEYKLGRYEESAAIWQEVLKRNGNYDMAYIGIGRAALRQGKYEEAMEYYRLKYYDEGYGKAFQYYRKEWVEANLWWMMLVIVLLIIGPWAVKTIIRVRKEIIEA
jgi:tetratricopeptide (TPR) repeat protein